MNKYARKICKFLAADNKIEKEKWKKRRKRRRWRKGEVKYGKREKKGGGEKRKRRFLR